MLIKIHPKLLNFICSRVDNELETAFYLIGFRFSDEIYVVDAIEFLYEERSSVFVKSNPFQFGLLSLATISELKIIGVLHTHPFSHGKPSPSSMDIEDMIARENLPFLIISGSFDISCIYDDKECRVEEEEFTFRSLEIDDEIVYFMGDKPATISLAEEKYKTYLFSQIENHKVIKPIFFDIILLEHPFKIRYRLRVKPSKVSRVEEIIKLTFGNELNGKKLYMNSDELKINKVLKELESGKKTFEIKIGENLG